jgi:glycosyltransferase involved in cell wall biosynthesis
VYMNKISVVIITKNEGHILERTLQSIQSLTDDIVIGDNGSTDNTLEIAKAFNANIIQYKWQGFGNAKNTVVNAAKYNWVLAIDADEVPTAALVAELKLLPLQNDNEIFIIKFLNFIGNRKLRYGTWTNVNKMRLFNKNFTCWEDKPIHESIIMPDNTKLIPLKNLLYHYCHNDIMEYAQKMTYYGNEMAQRYYDKNKKSSFFKLYIYPFFLFFYNFIFRLGFLDGSIGFAAAFLYSYYVFIKYHRLHELKNKNNI